MGLCIVLLPVAAFVALSVGSSGSLFSFTGDPSGAMCFSACACARHSGRIVGAALQRRARALQAILRNPYAERFVLGVSGERRLAAPQR